MRGALRRHGIAIDVAIACLLAALAQLEVWLGTGASGHRLAYSLITPVMAATVAARRRYPTAAGAVAGLLSLGAADAFGPPDLLSYALAWFLAMYGLAVWSRPVPFISTVGAFGAALIFSAVLGRTEPGFGQFVLTWLVLLVVSRFLVGEREQRLRLAEREKDLAAREALLEERARIARELHDVLAHEVSMIVVQAGAERRTLPAGHGSREVLETIENIGRSALEEMRRMVGMLRAEGPPAPQPRLADVPALIGRVRESGHPVELRIDGEERELPVGIELCAYRVIQEALTNAAKHASGAHTRVHLSYLHNELEVEVVNEGTSPSPHSPDGGHGLLGMRERVAIYNGRLSAEAGEDGGFRVQAHLPLR